jgi:hypothetical protein
VPKQFLPEQKVMLVKISAGCFESTVTEKGMIFLIISLPLIGYGSSTLLAKANIPVQSGNSN